MLPENQPGILSQLISPVTTLFAAFLGAWFAFLLQNKREKKKEENVNVSALNKVQINFVQQLNALTILNKDFIIPHREHPLTWVAIPAVPLRDYANLQIDGASLSFLTESGNANLISEILVEEESFKEVMKTLNLRSEVHVGLLQPKLEAIGFREGQDFKYSVEQVEEMLGPHLVGKLKRLTEGLITLTENAIKSHEEIIKKIKSTGTNIFPKKKILGFEYKNDKKTI